MGKRKYIPSQVEFQSKEELVPSLTKLRSGGVELIYNRFENFFKRKQVEPMKERRVKTIRKYKLHNIPGEMARKMHNHTLKAKKRLLQVKKGEEIPIL